MALPAFEQWSLAWPLAKKELLGRYRGSVGGLAWALVTPVLMVTVYALVFQIVFKARWAGADVVGLGYALRALKWFHRRVMLHHGLLIARAPLMPMERKLVSLLLTARGEKEIAHDLALTPATIRRRATRPTHHRSVRASASSIP